MNKQSCCPASHMWRSLLLWLSFALLAVSAQAQTTIEAVSGSVQGGVEFVRIDLSQPLTAVPTGFSIQSPARIALDFPGIANGMGRSTIDLNQGNLRSVSVVQAGDRTRVVLNLKQATAYKAQCSIFVGMIKEEVKTMLRAAEESSKALSPEKLQEALDRQAMPATASIPSEYWNLVKP